MPTIFVALMMKSFLFFYILLLTSLTGFSQVQSEISEEDSISNYLRLIDSSNKKISDAYNGISLGLKSAQVDSMAFATMKYKTVVMNIYNQFNKIEVSGFLVSIKVAYTEWIKSIVVYNNQNLTKLEEYAHSRRMLLKENPNANTRYVDQQILDFFEELDSTQNSPRNLLAREVENLISSRKDIMNVK